MTVVGTGVGACGRVTTADTGAPIRGAEVRLSMDGSFSRLVTTNGEGRYELRNLPAGLYKLSVSKSGFGDSYLNSGPSLVTTAISLPSGAT